MTLGAMRNAVAEYAYGCQKRCANGFVPSTSRYHHVCDMEHLRAYFGALPANRAAFHGCSLRPAAPITR